MNTGDCVPLFKVGRNNDYDVVPHPDVLNDGVHHLLPDLPTSVLLPGREISRLCSQWSCLYITALSLVESFIVMKYVHSFATPALLCHTEPAQVTQSLLIGTFLAFRCTNMA